MRRRTLIGSLLAAPLFGLIGVRPWHEKQIGRRSSWSVQAPSAAGRRCTWHSPARGSRWSTPGVRATRVRAPEGETRVIRHGYSDLRYVELAQRSLTLWREWSAAWDRPLFHETGVVFLRQAGHAESFFDQAAGHLGAAGVPHETLDAGEIAARFPQLDADGLVSGLFEPTAGYLLARRACEAVAEAVQAAGGELLIATARPGPLQSGMMKTVTLDDGRQLGADSFVFACGPWLGALFPELFADRLRVSRQEVFYFGTPSGDERYAPPALPVWAIFGERIWYGIPGGERRGFKLADDTRGPAFEPTAGDRRVDQEGVQRARVFLGERFPGWPTPPSRAAGSASTRIRRTTTSSSIATRRRTTSGWWAAARVMASSTDRRWGS